MVAEPKLTSPGEPTEEPPPNPEMRTVKAEELFRGEREVRIDYGGVCYRLRITRRHRLILQK